MLRSRLILRLEQQHRGERQRSRFVYEALKVYLMLGGLAPKVDDELIIAWMRQRLGENLYPGAANARGPARCSKSISRPCSTSTSAQRPTFELNGPLIERRSARWRA